MWPQGPPPCDFSLTVDMGSFALCSREEEREDSSRRKTKRSPDALRPLAWAHMAAGEAGMHRRRAGRHRCLQLSVLCPSATGTRAHRTAKGKSGPGPCGDCREPESILEVNWKVGRQWGILYQSMNHAS